MAKKYRHIERIDQNTPQTDYRKYLVSSKKNNNWAILGYFSPSMQIWKRQNEAYSNTKKLKKQSILSQIRFWIQLQTFPWHCNTRNINPKTWPTEGKNQSYKRRSYIHQYNEVKGKLYTNSFIYVWTKFEHQVKDVNFSQKFQVFSSLCRQEKLFRYAQGHQRAGALTDSNIITQNTSIRV